MLRTCTSEISARVINLLEVVCLGVLSPNPHVSLAYCLFSSRLQSFLMEGILETHEQQSQNHGTHGVARPTPTNVRYSSSIRLTAKFISILENNNLWVSRGSPRNRFKLDYHLSLDLFQLSLDTYTSKNLTKPKSPLSRKRA